MSLYPIFLKLENRPILIVGAGKVALEKVESLLPTGARLTVVAPQARPEIAVLAHEEKLQWIEREFLPSDIEGAFLVVTATNFPGINHAVYELCVERGVLCNAVDDPPFCDFYFSSIVRRDDLQIAISTAGQSPALAQRLRREIDEQLPEDIGPWLANLGQLRREVLTQYPAGETRRQLLHELAHRSVCESESCPSRQLAYSAAREIAI
jgi:siroheme synthase-like protein